MNRPGRSNNSVNDPELNPGCKDRLDEIIFFLKIQTPKIVLDKSLNVTDEHSFGAHNNHQGINIVKVQIWPQIEPN